MTAFRPRFFVHQDNLPAASGLILGPGVEVTLGTEDSHHAARVLRLREGDECEVVVGTEVYAASVCHSGPPVRLELEAHLEGRAAGARYRLQVGIVQAVARPALFDQLLEKGTEVGASFFLLVAPSDPDARRADRWRRIVLEAAKQSKQVRVPEVDTAQSVEQALDSLGMSETTSVVLHPGAKVALREWLERSPGFLHVGSSLGDEGKEQEPFGGRVALWVGPEGGWSEDELERFSESGVEMVRMGQSVLRTETAGPVAVALTRLLLGDW